MAEYFKDNFIALLPRLYDRSDETGDLNDFLEIIASEFDSVKDLIDEFTKLFDVKNVPAKYLPYLAALLDYDYDFTRNAETQRAEVTDLVEVYRRRGTIPGILRKLRLAGYVGTLRETYKYTVRLGKTGRGMKTGMKLAGKKYAHGVFEVSLRKMCRELWDILWDEVPRGRKMYAAHTETAKLTDLWSMESKLTGDSLYRAGTGILPMKLYNLQVEMVVTKTA